VAILCLLEVRLSEVALTFVERWLDGFQFIHFRPITSDPNANGMMVVVRQELRESLKVVARDARSARWAVCTFHMPSSIPIHMAFVHGLADSSAADRSEYWRDVRAGVQGMSHQCLLVIGDANAFIDEEDACTTARVPCRHFAEFVENTGLTDAWKHCNAASPLQHSFERPYTDADGNRWMQNSRIDHAFVSSRLLRDTVDCVYDDFDPVISPDHRPVVISTTTVTFDGPVPAAEGPRRVPWRKLSIHKLPAFKEEYAANLQKWTDPEKERSNDPIQYLNDVRNNSTKSFDRVQRRLKDSTMQTVGDRLIDANASPLVPHCILGWTMILNRMHKAVSSLVTFAKTTVRTHAMSMLDENPQPFVIQEPDWQHRHRLNCAHWFAKIVQRVPSDLFNTVAPQLVENQRYRLKVAVINETCDRIFQHFADTPGQKERMWDRSFRMRMIETFLECLIAMARVEDPSWSRVRPEGDEKVLQTIKDSLKTYIVQIILPKKEITDLQVSVDREQLQSYKDQISARTAELRSAMQNELCNVRKANIRNYTKRRHNDFAAHGFRFMSTASVKNKHASQAISEVHVTDDDGKVRCSTDPQTVKAAFARDWEAIFRAPASFPDSPEPWFDVPVMRQIAERLRGTSETLMKVPSIDEVRETIRAMSSKTSTDPSGLSITMYKFADEECVRELTEIFRRVIEENDIPEQWRLTSFYLLHKGGPKGDTSAWRPIALLDQGYKILTSIINNRLKKLVEEQRVFDDSQTGFRAGRSVHENILTLLAAIEKAGIEKLPLHILYFDFRKAYDSVPISKLLHTLRRFGFHESFVNFIELIYKNCVGSIITAFGPTSSFALLNGVRQGDPLSCLLFLLFLMPLLYYIQYLVPSVCLLGCADDIASIIDSCEKSQQIMDAASEFLTANQMQLSIDVLGKSKTVYTHNQLGDDGNCRPEMQVFYRNLDNVRIQIPILHPTEHYRYLGVYINLNKDWTRQYVVLRNMLRSQARWLRNRAYTVLELAEIVKLIMMPTMEYRLRICSFTDKQLNELIACLTSVIYRKLGIRRPLHQLSHDAPIHLQVRPEHFGLDLPTVRLWGKAIKVLTILENGLNSKNVQAREAALYLWTKESEYRIDVKHALQVMKLKLVTGDSLHRDPRRISTWAPRDLSPDFLETLQSFSITNLTHLFGMHLDKMCVQTHQYKLVGPRQPTLQRVLEEKGLVGEWNRMRQALTNQGGRVMNPQIRDSLLDYTEEWKWEEIERMATVIDGIACAWTDGSAIKNSINSASSAAGSAVYVHSELHMHRRTPGKQTSFCAELFAILLLLLKWPRNRPLRVISDNLAALKVVSRAHTWTEKKWRNVDYAPFLLQIVRVYRLRNQNEVPTLWTHTYSHVSLRSQQPENLRKLDILFRKFGNATPQIILGNAAADKLAAEGCKLPQSLNFWQWLELPYYALASDDNAENVVFAERKNLKQTCKEFDLELLQSRKAFSTVPLELRGKIDLSAAKRLMTCRTAAYSILMAWCIKVKTKKLKVLVPIPDALDLNNLRPEQLCPFHEKGLCLNEPETLEHIFHCKGTEELRNQLSEVILYIVNIFRGCATTPGIEKKFAFLQWWCRAAKKPLDPLNGKARDKLTFFPRFYSSQIPTDAERQEARRLKISNLLRASNDFFSYGHVPRALSVALVTVGVDKLYVKDAVDQIQAAIAWTGSRCWAMRCKFFWDQKKEREKQLREQERLQRVAAYRERLEEEERQHLAMLARRVQLAAQQSRAENDERDADMERVAENDDNFPT
jgi:endonuclease/exonuclease/phosphatase family metal-dependent hydrolase